MPSDSSPFTKKQKHLQVTCRFETDFDCSDLLIEFLSQNIIADNVVIKIQDKSVLDFSEDNVARHFYGAFAVQNMEPPAFNISDTSRARLAILSILAENQYSTFGALRLEINYLKQPIIRSALAELLQRGTIIQTQKGIYTINNISDAYHDEIVGFRSAIEQYKPTPAEFNILNHITKKSRKSDLVDLAGVSRQRIDQLIKRLLDKGLLVANGPIISKTSLCDIIMKRKSPIPL